MKRLLAGLALALLIVSPVSASAGSGVDSISLDGTASFGQVVTFTISLAEKKYDCDRYNGRCARVNLSCYQAGVLVEGRGMDLDTARSGVGLSGYYWTSGAADCVADLFRWSTTGPGIEQYVLLATTSFHVSD